MSPIFLQLLGVVVALACFGCAFAFKDDTATAAALAGAGLSILTAVGIRRPGDIPLSKAEEYAFKAAVARKKEGRSLGGLLFLLAIPFALPQQSCVHGAFKWPDVAKCGSDVGGLVGIVTQLLLNDAGVDDVTPATKQKLQQLAEQYGAGAVLCIVDTLVSAWQAPAASPEPHRLAAARRGTGFLASAGTRIEHVQ